MRDGSLDATKIRFNTTFNRKLKMRDTFTKIFPSYNHGEATTFAMNKSIMHNLHTYPKRNDDGHITHAINREHTHKKDVMKNYHESMLKIADMRRVIK
jgi:hypothetical protein